ncbi:hypothetical protein ACOBV9_04955 [Pseudoalteromonas espejiana]
MLKPLCYSLTLILAPMTAVAQTMVIKTTDELITTDSPLYLLITKRQSN